MWPVVKQREEGAVGLRVATESIKLDLDWRVYRDTNLVPTSLKYNGITMTTSVIKLFIMYCPDCGMVHIKDN